MIGDHAGYHRFDGAWSRVRRQAGSCRSAARLRRDVSGIAARRGRPPGAGPGGVGEFTWPPSIDRDCQPRLGPAYYVVTRRLRNQRTPNSRSLSPAGKLQSARATGNYPIAAFHSHRVEEAGRGVGKDSLAMPGEPRGGILIPGKQNDRTVRQLQRTLSPEARRVGRGRRHVLGVVFS